MKVITARFGQLDEDNQVYVLLLRLATLSIFNTLFLSLQLLRRWLSDPVFDLSRAFLPPFRYSERASCTSNPAAG